MKVKLIQFSTNKIINLIKKNIRKYHLGCNLFLSIGVKLFTGAE